ncbi:uncharacterized protein LOC131540596 [Onychostoma macrolepis]|uniref:uncharacterized protein LOC131540596 n=1 Tax=Onychostoma macrolepis TaxID=369639 RepID=UPI00272C561D|nr:uncharacterized protein LOC131540596 [Onychostoma macrolepis]
MSEKKVVGCFSYSWRRRRELSEAQKELKLPQHKLKTECPTRWGSKQAMIARVLEQQCGISCVLSVDRKARHLVPTWQDIEVLGAVNNSLSPLAEFPDALSREQYPQPSVSVTVREEAEDQNAPALKTTKKTLGSFFKVDEDHRPASSSLSSLQAVAITSELQLSAAVDSEENPLFWWKEHAKQFPALSKLAQKYLCIPATSSPSERVFSTGGNIVTCLRASLKPESVDSLVFLAKNL